LSATNQFKSLFRVRLDAQGQFAEAFPDSFATATTSSTSKKFLPATATGALENPLAKPAEGVFGVAGEHPVRIEHDPARGQGVLASLAV